MGDRALIKEAHYTTHIEGTRLTLDCGLSGKIWSCSFQLNYSFHLKNGILGGFWKLETYLGLTNSRKI